MIKKPEKKYKNYITKISNHFMEIESIESIILIGSMANKTATQYSDIDIAVFSNNRLMLQQRMITINKFTELKYLNIIQKKHSDLIYTQNINIEIYYYEIKKFISDLDKLMNNPDSSSFKLANHIHQFLIAKILYDKRDWFIHIQNYLDQPYPTKLKNQIIKHHLPKIQNKYLKQIKSAQKHQNIIKIPKIISQIIDSVIQVTFAFNESFPPPLIKITNQISKLKYTPYNLINNLNDLSNTPASVNDLTNIINQIIKDLNRMLSIQQYAEYKPNWIQYISSLPERIFRTIVVVIFGTLYELSEKLLPNFITKSRIYQSTIAKSFQLILTTLGKVEGLMISEQSSGTQLMVRKSMGNIIEYGSMAAIGFSPLWIMAAVADITGGTKIYLNEFTKQLKKMGLVDKETNISSVTHLLNTLEHISAHSSKTIDLPPITIKQLTKIYNEYKHNSKNLPNQEELQQIYQHIKGNSRKEHRSISEISWIIALGAQKTGIQLGREYILDYYKEALLNIQEQGLHNYILHNIQPYKTAIYYHMHPSSITWSEKYLISKQNN